MRTASPRHRLASSSSRARVSSARTPSMSVRRSFSTVERLSRSSMRTRSAPLLPALAALLGLGAVARRSRWNKLGLGLSFHFLFRLGRDRNLGLLRLGNDGGPADSRFCDLVHA